MSNFKPVPKPTIDLAGKRFYGWLVLKFSHRSKCNYYWHCRCVCGREKPIRSDHVKSGAIPNCGCVRRHYMSSSSEYASWIAMRSRTLRPTASDFPRYGGKGIELCQRWRNFKNFFADMGYKPTSLHTIDRKNNKGHYSCGKCDDCIKHGWPANGRWATRKEQANNRG